MVGLTLLIYYLHKIYSVINMIKKNIKILLYVSMLNMVLGEGISPVGSLISRTGWYMPGGSTPPPTTILIVKLFIKSIKL